MNRCIALLAYPNCLPSTLFAFRDLVLFANQIAQLHGKPPIAVELVSADGDQVALADKQWAQTKRFNAQRFSYLVVPGFLFGHPDELPQRLEGYQKEAALIASAYGRGLTIASNCVGAFLLGRAGILAQRKVTTSWVFESTLQNLFENARVDARKTLEIDGRIMSSGAYSAMNEIAFHLIRTLHGDKVAHQTQNLTLHTSIGENQYKFVDQSLMRHTSSNFSKAVENWLIEHMKAPYSLEHLASFMSVSPRTLLRRYKKETQTTPLAFLQRRRIERAKHLLLSTSQSIELIAQEVGYQDPNAFRQIFRREVHETPSDYRKTIRLSH